MSMMFTHAEVRCLDYQASRMELVRVTTGPSYDTAPSYVLAVAARAALTAGSPRELGLVVSVVRRWLNGRGGEEERRRIDAVVASREFAPDLSPALAFA
jgi:hypothetical protein